MKHHEIPMGPRRSPARQALRYALLSLGTAAITMLCVAALAIRSA